MRGLFVLWMVLWGVLASAQAFVIHRFDCAIKLDSDGTMNVTETLSVTFQESRRGIFRVLPTALPNGKGATRSIFVTNIACSDGSGRADELLVTAESGQLRVRIGDPDVYLTPGTSRDYVINYRVRNAINWFDKDERWQPSAELYWNVTGAEWETFMEKVTVNVSFPEVSQDSDVRARIFRGPYGSTAAQAMEGVSDRQEDPQTQTWMSLARNQLLAGTDVRMPVGEQVTIVLAVPAQLIEKPDFMTQAWWFLLPNLGFLLPIAALLIGLASYWVIGRDPHGGPMVVQFDPPDGLSGPECGSFIDERVDNRDIAAGFISLAVKGYLVIESSETGLLFKRKTADMLLTDKPEGPDLTLFERELYRKLRRCGDLVTEHDLRTEIAPEIGSLKTTLYESLVAHGYYLKNPSAARTSFGLLAFGIILLLGFVATALSPLRNIMPAIVGGIFSVPILIWAILHAPKRTARGARAWALVKGFEEFMTRARAPELEWLSKAHPDQALFEKYLPHAVAMGTVDQWADAFRGIELQNPSWYSTTHPGVFYPHLFASDLNSISGGLGSAASTPPRSDGASGGGSGFSSGGGFSGGGFGGGGGGSW